MPAHAVRAVGYTTAGLVIVATLLLFVGQQRARALGDSPTPSASAAAPSPAPSPVAAAAKPSGPYRVVGLGDSVPAGNACGCTTYVSLVGRHEAAQQGTTASVSNLAQGGLTTSGLLTQLKSSSVKKKIAAADLVIITIGANDFATGSVASASCGAPALSCFQSTLKQQKAQLDSVFSKVGALTHATVLVTGYWNVFLDGTVAAAHGSAYVRNSVALTRAENAQIANTARSDGATYVGIFTPFKGTSGTRNDTSLLASDGDHPNAAGHRKIAVALEAAL